MNANEIMTLGLGLTPPWQVVSSELDLESNPTELKLELSAGGVAAQSGIVLQNIPAEHTNAFHDLVHMAGFEVLAAYVREDGTPRYRAGQGAFAFRGVLSTAQHIHESVNILTRLRQWLLASLLPAADLQKRILRRDLYELIRKPVLDFQYDEAAIR